jgi:hypothetical protein
LLSLSVAGSIISSLITSWPGSDGARVAGGTWLVDAGVGGLPASAADGRGALPPAAIGGRVFEPPAPARAGAVPTLTSSTAAAIGGLIGPSAASKTPASAGLSAAIGGEVSTHPHSMQLAIAILVRTAASRHRAGCRRGVTVHRPRAPQVVAV